MLQSIYGQDCLIHKDQHACEVYVHPSEDDRLSDSPFRLCVYFPDSYPSTSEPVVEMVAHWLSEEAKQRISGELHRIFLENAGNVIIFTWVEWLKEQDWIWEETRKRAEVKRGREVPVVECEMMISIANKNDDAKNVGKGSLAASSKFHVEDAEEKDVSSEQIHDKNLEELDTLLGITHGAPFTEKKSTFQAHLAAINSVDQVETVMEALLRNRKIAGATHNIMAYRISLPEKGTVLQDYDDDGETAAGGRLLHLLQIVDAVNVVVVVSRWFGGILLGPDRFKHINNSARCLLDTCGYIKGSGQAGSQNDKQKLQSKGASQKGKRR